MVATEPIPERLFDCPHYSRHGFDYWQQREDGRILAGGFRDTSLATEFTTSEETTPEIQSALDSFVSDLVGWPVVVTHRWAGLFGFVPDLMPVVGRVPGEDGLWVAGGYSGTAWCSASCAASWSRTRSSAATRRTSTCSTRRASCSGRRGAPRGHGRRPRARDRRLVRRQRARRVVGHERRARRVLHLRGRRGRLPRARLHARSARAGHVRRPLPPGVEPGGLPRARRGVPAVDRGRGTAAACLGLRALPGGHRARLRRRGGWSVPDLHDRRPRGREADRLPALGARAASRCRCRDARRASPAEAYAPFPRWQPGKPDFAGMPVVPRKSSAPTTTSTWSRAPAAAVPPCGSHRGALGGCGLPMVVAPPRVSDAAASSSGSTTTANRSLRSCSPTGARRGRARSYRFRTRRRRCSSEVWQRGARTDRLPRARDRRGAGARRRPAADGGARGRRDSPDGRRRHDDLARRRAPAGDLSASVRLPAPVARRRRRPAASHDRRNGEQVAERLAECSIYDPSSTCSCEAPNGDVAAYVLFWPDPVTRVGLVEPMRIEDRVPATRARAPSPHGWARSARRARLHEAEGGLHDANPAARELYLRRRLHAGVDESNVSARAGGDSEVDLRQVELVRDLVGGERDREVLDREPGRVEHRDLVGRAAPGRLAGRAPRRARSRRSRATQAGLDRVREVAGVARLPPVVAEDRARGPARPTAISLLSGPSAPIRLTCWPGRSEPSRKSTCLPGVTVDDDVGRERLVLRVGDVRAQLARGGLGARAVDVEDRDLPAAGEERPRHRLAVHAGADDRTLVASSRGRASRRRAPPPRPSAARSATPRRAAPSSRPQDASESSTVPITVGRPRAGLPGNERDPLQRARSRRRARAWPGSRRPGTRGRRPSAASSTRRARRRRTRRGRPRPPARARPPRRRAPP